MGQTTTGDLIIQEMRGEKSDDNETIPYAESDLGDKQSVRGRID